MHRPIISEAQQQLAETIRDFQVPAHSPLNISPWIAMSLMQKAIRRGHEELALRAAATLLIFRLSGCGGDAAVLRSRTWVLLISKLSRSLRRPWRGNDFALSSAANGRSQVSSCPGWPALPNAGPLMIFCWQLSNIRPSSKQDGVRRYHAPGLDGGRNGYGPVTPAGAGAVVRRRNGRRPSPHLQPRRGDPTQVFDALGETEIPQTVVEICARGVSQDR